MEDEPTMEETLDLSRRGMKKIEKAPQDSQKPIVKLVLDHNELQRLENIDTYTRVEDLSICNNFLMRMHGVSRLTCLRVLSLNNNGLLQIEGLKDLLHLRVLKLSGNNIKSIEHLNHNMHLEHLDLSTNQICFIADISYLKNLKYLNLERNKIMDLRQCDRYLPPQLEHLALGNNNIQDLNEVGHLAHLTKLESFSIQGNPCVAMAGKDKLGFDYRPFILNWMMSVKTIDGFVVSAIESLRAEWLYSQGKGRHHRPGQHAELCEYLCTACPLSAAALDTSDQRKLRKVLSKAQLHQQQLKEQTSPARSRLQSPRLHANRHAARSPERMAHSYHAARAASPPEQLTRSYHEPSRAPSADRRERRTNDFGLASTNTPTKPHNQTLEAASKMVPVPESLMSPDYQDPVFDIHRQKDPMFDTQKHPGSERRPAPNKLRSPKLTKSACNSPRLRSKIERKGSLNGKTNGLVAESVLDAVRARSVETKAAVTIQRMWRGYRSRNLNGDTLKILHAIQAARARQHIQKLTCDMEATKAALESERKIQQLQMQAINALWKKVSTMQVADNQKSRPDEESGEALRALAATCYSLQSEVVELRGCMREVLRAVSGRGGGCGGGGGGDGGGGGVATQTDICAVTTPQEERSVWLRRPQSLQLTHSSAPAAPARPPADIDKTESEVTSIQDETDLEKTDSVKEESLSTEVSEQLSAINEPTAMESKHLAIAADGDGTEMV